MLAFCARTKSPFMQPGYRDKSPARALAKEKARTRTLPLPWACTGVVFRERHLEASGGCVSHSAAPGTPLLEELHPQQLPAPRQHRRNQGEGLGLGARSLPRCRRRAAPSLLPAPPARIFQRCATGGFCLVSDKALHLWASPAT